MTNIVWNTDVNGSWATASNWDDDVSPNSLSDNITLGTLASAYTVTYSALSDTVGFLYVQTGATLAIASGTLTIGGTSDTGTLYDTGTISVASGAILDLAGPYAEIVGGGSLSLAGTLELSAAAGAYPGLFGGKIALTGGSILGAVTQTDQLIDIDDSLSGYGVIGNGYSVSTGGSTTNNSPGLNFQISDGATIDATGAAGQALTLNTGANTIENAGLLESTSAGGLVIDSSLYQDSSLIAAKGGTITFADGAQVGGNGLTQVQAGGTLVFNDATYNSTGVLDIGSSTAAGGVVTTTAGNLVSSSTGDLINSTIFNDGTFDVVANSELVINGSVIDGSNSNFNLDAGSLSSEAAIVQLYSGGLTFHDGAVTLSNSAHNEFISQGSYTQLSNLAILSGSGVIGDGYVRLFNGVGGVIDADGTAGLTIEADTLGYEQDTSTNFDNFNVGLLEATAAGTATTAIGLLTLGTGSWNNAGKIVAGAQGKIALDGADINDGGGQIDVANGGWLRLEDGAKIYNQTDIVVNGAGLLSMAGDGSTDEIETTLYLSGTIDIGATADLLAADRWLGTGLVNLGSASGSATITVDTGKDFDLLGGGVFDLLNVGDKIISAGAGAAFRNRGDTIAGAGVIGDANLGIVNTLGATIDATGALTLGSTNTSAPTVQNGGVLEATGTGLLTIAGDVNNTGDIIVKSGATVVAEQNVSNVGRVDLDGGTAEFADVVNNQTYFDAGATSSLVLEDPQGQDGNISGFAAGDTIDLANFSYGNGTIELVNPMNSLDGYLVLQNSLGTQSQGFGLDGNYTSSAGAFSFTEDKSGGTIIHWTAAKA